MQTLLPVHIAAGAVGILAGYAALLAAKGAGAHRKSGTWFVWSMLVMGLTGATMAALGRGEASVIAGVLVSYLVITGMTTVRPFATVAACMDIAGMLLASALGVAGVAFGVGALATPAGALDGVPALMFFIFGGVALLAAAGDLRMIRAGRMQGGARLARHLWRMCFALWIAASSFFLGQADEFPEWFRVWPVLGTLAFFPLLAMAYWLWRVRGRNALRRARVSAPEAAPSRARMPVATG